MIKTITTYTGDSRYAQAAQQHAMALATQFDARLKIVGLWDGQASGSDMPGTDSAQAFAERNQEELLRAARDAGIQADGSLRGDGLVDGLLAEAWETDILVLGLPTEEDKDTDDMASRLIRSERPILRKADCSLLAVNQPPVGIHKVMAKCTGGIEGKATLRMAGAIAERCGAEVLILVVENDVARAGQLAAAGQEYLKGYAVPGIEIQAQAGPSDSKVDILEAAKAFQADLIVIGEEGHTWLECALGENVAERAALSTSTPLLVAR